MEQGSTHPTETTSRLEDLLQMRTGSRQGSILLRCGQRSRMLPFPRGCKVPLDGMVSGYASS